MIREEYVLTLEHFIIDDRKRENGEVVIDRYKLEDPIQVKYAICGTLDRGMSVYSVNEMLEKMKDYVLREHERKEG